VSVIKNKYRRFENSIECITKSKRMSENNREGHGMRKKRTRIVPVVTQKQSAYNSRGARYSFTCILLFC
jgi:hypothetical protein